MNSATCRVAAGQKGLRLACDVCHQGKVKCSGGTPCEGCRRLGVRCKYSTSNRTGRPKGVKNKKTLERIQQLRDDDENDYERTTVAGDGESSRPAKRQPSKRQSLSTSQAEQICVSTSADSRNHSQNGVDSNLNPIAGNIPNSSWDGLLVSQPWNFLGPDHAQSITAAEDVLKWHTSSDQGHSASNYQSFDYLDLFDADNIPGCMPPESCGDNALFAATDLSPNWNRDMDNALRSLQAPHNDSLATQKLGPTGADATGLHIRPSSACNCVRQITEQLASCKALSVHSQQFQPDAVLTVARDTLIGWRNYLQCPSCQQSADKDVLVLSVMAFRALLNLIQRSGVRSQCKPQRDGTKDTNLTPENSSVQSLDSQNSFLGAYRLTREEKRLVMGLLLHKALKSLDHVAKHLTEKSLNMAGTPKAYSQSDQSFRSDSSLLSSVMSPTTYHNFPDVSERSDREDESNSAGSSVPLVEHDNYLHGSLQSLTARIKFLMSTIQNPQTCPNQGAEDILGF